MEMCYCPDVRRANPARRSRVSSPWLAVGLLIGLACAGCGASKKTAATAAAGAVDSKSAEPDKLLYEKAMDDIQHSRHTVARLELQTLLNSYPDSEYQAKAKLALADSYFKEGGATNLTQSIAEYQDFITFFPFLDESAYAQSQVGMAHYRKMEKPDRDHDEALEAEGAFQTFLQKYPNSPQHAEVEQRLRDVQEVLAEGDYAIASFYFLRGVYIASAARLTELVDRYPLFSQADRANWMLASIYEKTEHNEYAGPSYARIVKNYPLSPLAGDAKAKLIKFGMPVPQPDAAALARMQTEQNAPRERASFIARPLGMLKTGPNVSMAARSGDPTLTPPDDGTRQQTLTPTTTSVGGGGGAAAGTGAYVETVTPGSAGSIAPSPAADASTAAAPAGDPPPAAQPAPATDAAAPAAGATAPASGAAAPASSTDSSSSSSQSKKKKGLHKILPF